MPQSESKAQKAFQNRRKNPHSQWDTGNCLEKTLATGTTARARLGARLFIPAIQPKFRVSENDSIFAIGSCFARRLEESLTPKGFSVLSSGLADFARFSHEGASGFELNGLLNRYNVFSILNELEWVFEPESTFPRDALLDYKEGLVQDVHSHGIKKLVSVEETLERRQAFQGVFQRLPRCKLVVVTLGMTEVWYDERFGRYMNIAPNPSAVQKEPDRFKFRITSFFENRACLEKVYDLLKTHGHPGLRIIVTVSPVTLGCTFSSADVVVANSLSKSTLRSVAGDFADAHDDVDYFPSYEIVMNSDRTSAFAWDFRHVSRESANHVIDIFTQSYVGAG